MVGGATRPRQDSVSRRLVLHHHFINGIQGVGNEKGGGRKGGRVVSGGVRECVERLGE